MLSAWRIVKEKYAPTAFTGEGAALVGGRWNSAGLRAVYVSSSRALAALESLVHLNPPILFRYVAIPVSFPESLVEITAPSSLPDDWRESPVPPSTQRFGDQWLRESRSAVLDLPSVIIPGESNFLLNPLHPDFPKVTIGKPEAFAFDPRLFSA